MASKVRYAKYALWVLVSVGVFFVVLGQLLGVPSAEWFIRELFTWVIVGSGFLAVAVMVFILVFDEIRLDGRVADKEKQHDHSEKQPARPVQ